MTIDRLAQPKPIRTVLVHSDHITMNHPNKVVKRVVNQPLRAVTRRLRQLITVPVIREGRNRWITARPRL